MGKIIATDFDGTIVTNEYPEIGKPNTGLLFFLKEQKKIGSKIILWSCRKGEFLQKAIDYCKNQGVEFDAVNDNLEEIKQQFGGDTRKVYADIYIDDHNWIWTA